MKKLIKSQNLKRHKSLQNYKLASALRKTKAQVKAGKFQIQSVEEHVNDLRKTGSSVTGDGFLRRGL